jgi:hypothetical protein
MSKPKRKHTDFETKRQIANYLQDQLNPKDANGYVSYKAPRMCDPEVAALFDVSSNVVRGIRQLSFGSLKPAAKPGGKSNEKLEGLSKEVDAVYEHLKKLDTFLNALTTRLSYVEKELEIDPVKVALAALKNENSKER